MIFKNDRKSDLRLPNRIDGVIMLGLNADRLAQNAALLKKLRSMPCVRVMAPFSNDYIFDHVVYDSQKTGLLTAQYLKDNLCRNIIMVNTGSAISIEERATFIRQGLENYDCSFSVLAPTDDKLLDESGRIQKINNAVLIQLMENIRKITPVPDAIVTGVDLVSLGIRQYINNNRDEALRDVKIIGVNNDRQYLDCVIPPPATIDICVEEIARLAVERVLWRLDHPNAPALRLDVSPKLIV